MFVLFWVLVLIVLLLCGHLGGAALLCVCMRVWVSVCLSVCLLQSGVLAALIFSASLVTPFDMSFSLMVTDGV